jgi:hypothetical protein
MAQPSTNFEIFDSKGHMLPLSEIEPQLAKCDDATRRRFDAVRTAALEAAGAAAATKAAMQRVADVVIELRDAEETLKTLRPRVSAVDAARAWIATTNPRR